MEQEFIGKLKILESQSDLKALRSAMDNYSSLRKSISQSPEYAQLSGKLNGYLAEAENGKYVAQEEIIALKKAWKKLLIGRAIWKNWVIPRALTIITAGLIFLPLLYYKGAFKPGYELLIIVPGLILAVYMVLKKRQ